MVPARPPSLLRLAAFALPLLLAACASAPPTAWLPEDDPKATATVYAAERAHLGREPRIGLALSGGGTKAAAFSHGVLHGLQQQGVLQRVDVVSTASGGGYAAYWYLSKWMEWERLRRGPDAFAREDIFRDCFPSWLLAPSDNAGLQAIAEQGRRSLAPGEEHCGDVDNRSADGLDRFRWQAHLLRWPDVMRKEVTVIEGGSAQASATGPMLRLVLPSLAEFAIGGLSGVDGSFVSQRYQYGIERAWGLNPKARTGGTGATDWRYTNDSHEAGWDPQLHVDPATMRWDRLRALYVSGQPSPPVWVLNTNVGDKQRLPERANLYELTPFWHGNSARGRETALPPLASVATGLRASAGFTDSQGVAVRDKRELMNAFSRWLPSLQWGVPIDHHGPDGQVHRLRMSDGGGADNLALVSLVRRQLRDIIVVDTAADVSGSMDDLCWSRQALAALKVDLAFDELPTLGALCDARFAQPAGGQPSPALRAYNISAWLNPVVHGTATWRETGAQSRLWLVKAAWDQQAIRRAYNAAAGWKPGEPTRCGPGRDQVDCALLLFYGHNTTETTDSGYMIFPQHSTAAMTANASSQLLLGYRDLGRRLARELAVAPDGTVHSLARESCEQPMLYWHQGRQPEPWPADPAADPRAQARCTPRTAAP